MSAWSDAVLALSPSSFWRFEGASPLADSGSAGLTMTGVGSPVRVPSLVPGELSAANNAYDLDGSTMYLHAGDNYDFAGEVDWTIIYWMRIESASFGSGFQRMIEKRNTASPNAGYLYYGQGAGNVTFDLDFGTTTEGQGAAAALAQDVAYFMGLTWQDSTQTLRYYKNGSEFDSKTSWTVAPGFPVTTANFSIGANGTSASFAGVVDDVAVWEGTALSAANFTTLWTAAQAAEKQSFYVSRRRTTRR